jgi:hypothetical protein
MTNITPRDILVANGVGNFVKTFNNSTDAVLPGHIVTTTGEAADGAVAWPDAANDISTGVVGCAPGHDIDTAYSVGDMMPVYMTGSGAEVWVRLKASVAAQVAGNLIGNDGATAANGLAIAGVEGTYELLGRITHWHNTIAAEQWVKVRLSI